MHQQCHVEFTVDLASKRTHFLHNLPQTHIASAEGKIQSLAGIKTGPIAGSKFAGNSKISAIAVLFSEKTAAATCLPLMAFHAGQKQRGHCV